MTKIQREYEICLLLQSIVQSHDLAINGKMVENYVTWSYLSNHFNETYNQTVTFPISSMVFIMH